MLPFLHAGRGRRGDDGHAQLAAPLLRAGAVAGDVQSSPRSSCGVALVPLMPSLGLPRDHGDRHRGARRWRGTGRDAVAVAARRRVPVSAGASTRAIPGSAQVLVLMGPGTIGLAATQVNLFVNTLLATSQGTGAVSWLTYAFRVMYLPIGLFGVSIATARPAGRLAACRGRRPRRDARHRRARARDDADGQRAGDARA